MKTIKIFLASSNELEAERDAITVLVAELNKFFKSRELQFEIERWEWLNSSMGPMRKQDEYNKVLEGCDMCLILFWQKFGVFTAEEFHLAAKRNMANKNPERIYVFFKDVKNNAVVSNDLQKFKDELYSRYQHFNDTFSTLDSLKLKFLLQLEIYQNDIIGKNTINIYNGHVCVEGNPIINFENVPCISKNSDYKKIKDELSLLYSEEDQKDIEKIKQLESILEQYQKNLLDTARAQARLLNDIIAERTCEAMNAFDQGDIKEADEILCASIITSESIIQNVRDARKTARKSIKELLLQAKYRMFNTSKSIDIRIQETYDIYKHAVSLAEEIGLKDLLYDELLLSFGDFLYEYDKPEETIEFRRMLLNYRIQNCGVTHEDTANAYLLYGKSINDVEEKMRCFLKAENILQKCFGENKMISLAEVYNSIGNAYLQKEDYVKALSNYESSLKIRKEVFGEACVEVAKSYHNIGNVYRAMKQYEKAKDYHFKALAIKQNAFKGEDKHSVATSLFGLGFDFKENDQIDEAQKFFKEALSMYSRTVGSFHSDTNSSRMALASTYLEKQDYTGLYETSLPLAENGNAMIQCGLGMLYESGMGVVKDYSEALKWYFKAAIQNESTALWHLGRMYFYGYGVDKDICKAKEYLTRSADLDNPEGLYFLALMYDDESIEGTDHTIAFKIFHKSAVLGNVGSQYRLGIMYAEGIGIDKEQSKIWLLKAAENNNARAYYSLLQIYVSGSQYKEALPWAEKALDAYPDNAKVNFLSAMVFQVTGYLQKALDCYERTLDILNDEQKSTIRRETVENEIDRIKRFSKKYDSSFWFRLKCKIQGTVKFD